MPVERRIYAKTVEGSSSRIRDSPKDNELYRSAVYIGEDSSTPSVGQGMSRIWRQG